MYCFWWLWLRRAPPRPSEMASELSASEQEFGSKYSCRETRPQILCVQACLCSGDVSRKELRTLCTDCCKVLSYVKAE